MSVPARVPLAGSVMSTIISMVTMAVLAVCLTRRVQNVQIYKNLPLATWLILIIYIDSTLFIFVTAIVTSGFGVNYSPQICDGAILLCLVCYMSTKILIYYFLVEKAYIIRGSRLPRLRTKLWLFNCFGMLLPYTVVVVMNFIFRIAYINDEGVCIIGMEKIAMLPLIIFDVIVNIYLTLLFIVPLRKLYSYQNSKNTALHTVALRSFVGSLATLTSSVVNLTILMVLKGEPGWICLMCCNADVLFSVLVLHWVTQVDSARGSTGTGSHSHQATVDNDRPATNATRGVPRTRRGSSNVVNAKASWPGHRHRESESKKGIPLGVIKTECRGMTFSKGRGSEDCIVELDKIRVQTEHTREIEIDFRSESETTETREYNTYKGEESMSAEKMV